MMTTRSNHSSNSPIEAISIYDEILLFSTLITAILVIPLNTILVVALCRRQLLTRPINWLFINIAVFESLYLLTRAAWLCEQDFDKYKLQCQGLDMVLRIVEKMCEAISSLTTALVAVLRARAVWRSRRNKITSLEKREALVFLIVLCAFGTLGPALLVGLTCGKLQKCRSGLNPLYGIGQEVHSLSEVLCVNSTVLVCYTYICVVLYQSNRSVVIDNRSISIDQCASNRPHSRTLIYLFLYVLFYTVLTAPAHLNLFFEPGCLNGSSDDERQIKISTTFDVLLPLGACGFNPLFLYTFNKAFRKSVSVIVSQVRKCSEATTMSSADDAQ